MPVEKWCKEEMTERASTAGRRSKIGALELPLGVSSVGATGYSSPGERFKIVMSDLWLCNYNPGTCHSGKAQELRPDDRRECPARQSGEASLRK